VTDGCEQKGKIIGRKQSDQVGKNSITGEGIKRKRQPEGKAIEVVEITESSSGKGGGGYL